MNNIFTHQSKCFSHCFGCFVGAYESLFPVVLKYVLFESTNKFFLYNNYGCNSIAGQTNPLNELMSQTF